MQLKLSSSGRCPALMTNNVICKSKHFLSTEKFWIHLKECCFFFFVMTMIVKEIWIAPWFMHFACFYLILQDECLSTWDIVLKSCQNILTIKEKLSFWQKKVSFIFTSYKMKTITCPQAMHPISTSISVNYL